MTPDLLPRALDDLRTDPVMAGLIARFGEVAWPPPGRGSGFAALVRGVIGQQLSVKAAASIEARVRSVAPDLAPDQLAAVTPDDLRALGLSWAKVRTVRALAERALTGLLDLDALGTADDETVVEALTVVPGIGRWTAEMFLMFGLARPDVFSWGDAGLRKAVGVLYGPDAGPEVAEAWRPWRSVASLYLWRSLQNAPLSS